MKALEHRVEDLRQLVDGQEPWSLRKRMHTLENDHRASELVREALDELREMRDRKSNRVREWGSFAIAIAALAVAILLRFHGGH